MQGEFSIKCTVANLFYLWSGNVMVFCGHEYTTFIFSLKRLSIMEKSMIRKALFVVLFPFVYLFYLVKFIAYWACARLGNLFSGGSGDPNLFDHAAAQLYEDGYDEHL